MASFVGTRVGLLVFVLIIVLIDVSVLLYLYWRGNHFKNIHTGKVERISGVFVVKKIWNSEHAMDVGPPFAFKKWGFIGNDTKKIYYLSLFSRF